MEDSWLSVDEISIYLGVTKDTIYKWLSERDLPAHKIGRMWNFNAYSDPPNEEVIVRELKKLYKGDLKLPKLSLIINAYDINDYSRAPIAQKLI